MIGQLKRIIEFQNLGNSKTSKPSRNLIAFTSGKGGVGKTVLSLNLAYLLSQKGKRVLFADLDVNFSNAHILLNIIVPKNLKDFFEGKSLLNNIISKVDNNFYLLAGDSGSMYQNTYLKGKISSLLTELKKISGNYDYVIIDTGQMNDREQMEILLSSDSIVIVTSPEPTAVMDAYVIVKILKQQNCCLTKHVIVNKCSDVRDSDITFNNLNTATEHFLNEKLHLMGYVNFDSLIHKSVTSQKLFSKEYFNSPVCKQISKLSGSLTEFVQVANINQS
ncbi:flagellum site-determining protein YlxH [bacterium BMS3Abin03]|nr:flagellum site-determining protein YlxH [bacterium BMS3Abin03]